MNEYLLKLCPPTWNIAGKLPPIESVEYNTKHYETSNGFIMKAFVTTEEPLVEGEVLNVPSEVASGIEWKA